MKKNIKKKKLERILKKKSHEKQIYWFASLY